MNEFDLNNLSPSVNGYRQKLVSLNNTVLHCLNYKRTCYEIKQQDYQPGPEMSLIGSKYGSSNNPRILFTRIAPNWNKDALEFGTAFSVSRFCQTEKNKSIDDLYDSLLNFWRDPQTNDYYKGYQYFNTVIGHGYLVEPPNKFHSENPKYGIKLILKEMTNRGILDTNDELLYYCAINNLVKCSGNKGSGNPSKILINYCQNYFRQEIDILSPEILISFGNDADKYMQRFGLSRNIKIYTNLPHPAFRPGPWNEQHPPQKNSKWKNENEKDIYKGCLDLRDRVQNLINKIAKQWSGHL